ncbi:hypothetical protein K432DRAFT_281461, partial [Lepidopterella palustris CBS 459.81]
TAESRINTECKTCPYTLCTNKLYYASDRCRTHGTEMDGDKCLRIIQWDGMFANTQADLNIWLRTNDGCYVTPNDLTLYDRSHEVDTANLWYRGEDSEKDPLTEEAATVVYDIEFNTCHSIGCDTMHYLKSITNVTVTCWTNDSTIALIGVDSTWLKTSFDCYVAQIDLARPVHQQSLDNCSPAPFLELKQPSDCPGFLSQRLKTQPTKINVTVSAVSASSRICPTGACSVTAQYEFGTEIWQQCLILGSSNFEMIWSQTTEFCYVKH